MSQFYTLPLRKSFHLRILLPPRGGAMNFAVRFGL
jgi:hypothetical protein